MSLPHTIPSGFHAGEPAIQRRAGVTADAARLERLPAPADLTGGSGRASRHDLRGGDRHRDDGLRWVSPLHGPPGFLSPLGRNSLEIQAVPRAGDPLARLPVGQPVGLIALDFPAARRIRVNGTLAASSAGLRIDAEQAFVNCPAHISPHEVRAGTVDAAASVGATLTADQTRLVQAADTFLLGTVHPERGADVSHKGGEPGVVRVDGDGLWWPDFAGNNMFNSFGNLLADPSAALRYRRTPAFPDSRLSHAGLKEVSSTVYARRAELERKLVHLTSIWQNLDGFVHVGGAR